MHLLLIITVIAGFFVISRICKVFLISKSNNFANNELSKSEKPPTLQSGGFGQFFGGYLAIFLNLVSFNHQKTNNFAYNELSKSEKPHNLGSDWIKYRNYLVVFLIYF